MKDVEGWEVRLSLCFSNANGQLMSLLFGQAGKSVYNNPKHRNGEWIVPL